jgi:hypothetical protein
MMGLALVAPGYALYQHRKAAAAGIWDHLHKPEPVPVAEEG